MTRVPAARGAMAGLAFGIGHGSLADRFAWHGSTPKRDVTKPRAPQCASASSFGWVVLGVGGAGGALPPLALLEPIAVAVHFQDVHVMGEPVEQDASQPFGTEDFGPFLREQRFEVIRIEPRS
jgi:hypothetical protein